MLVGVISDIHGHLSEQAYDALQPCDMILCAGDVERPTILMELDAIAPTVAVLGNCDSSLRGMDIPFTASPRIGGVRFFMTHRPKILAPLPKMCVWWCMATLTFPAKSLSTGSCI